MLESSSIFLQKCHIDRLLAEGAFIYVYLATHLPINASRTIKILRRDVACLGSSDFNNYRQRFHLEAQLNA
jgi:Uri superfamily endonuclease